MSARNPLIVCADICGFSAWSSAEKVKFSVSCTVHRGCYPNGQKADGEGTVPGQRRNFLPLLLPEMDPACWVETGWLS